MEDLGEIWREEFLSLERENTSDFERQNAIGNATNYTQAAEENDVTHAKMMQFEILLEASGSNQSSQFSA